MYARNRLRLPGLVCPLAVVLSVIVAQGDLRAQVPPLVVVSRSPGVTNIPRPRVEAVTRASRGRLLLVRSSTDFDVLVENGVTLGADVPADVTDPDISFDGTRVVFAGYSDVDGAWRIYEIGVDGERLRKITRSDRALTAHDLGEHWPMFASYDDVDPCYLPDGRVCFVSTRQPGIAPDERVRSTNLYVVDPATGATPHRITSERFAADTPVVDPSTGNIVYSRWWRSDSMLVQAEIEPGSPGYDGASGQGASARREFPNPDGVLRADIDESEFPGLNSWFLASVRPDGTELQMFSGFRIDREATQAYRPAFLPDGRILALFIPQTPFLGFPRGDGLRAFTAGAARPELLGGPQEFGGRAISRWRYASAEALDSERFVVSSTTVGGTPDFDIGIQRGAAEPVEYFGLQGTAELDPAVVRARPLPPILPDRAPVPLGEATPRTVQEALDTYGSFTFEVENIHFNAPLDVPVVNAPPVGKELTIEFFMMPQQLGTRPVEPILVHSEVIPIDGHVRTELPAGVPLFEVLRRPSGRIPVGRDGQIFHVGGFNFSRAAEHGRCVGCHAGHTMIELPEDSAWTNLAPSAKPTAVPGPGSHHAVAPFRPRGLVDRDLDPQTGEWTGGRVLPDETEVALQWSVPIVAKEFVLYAPPHGEGSRGTRDQTITGLRAVTRLDGVEQQAIDVRETLAASGTHVTLDPSLPFDRLVLTIPKDSVVGHYEGMRGPALAEIEVLARVPEAAEPLRWFLRGDTNCSGVTNLADMLTLFNHLFFGSAICCDAAADADADGALSITDGIAVGNALFLRGGIPAPHPRCSSGNAAGLSCDIQRCE